MKNTSLLFLSIILHAQTVNVAGVDVPTNAAEISTVNNCVAASASGTAYTCTTSPTFTPATGDSVSLECDVPNTGSATLAVNGASAATIKKWGNTNWGPNDCLAGQWKGMKFDGTNWQDQSQLGISYPPAFGTWTQTVMNGTANSTFGPLFMQPGSGSSQWVLLSRSQPSTPYTIDAAFSGVLASSAIMGIGWRESATSKTVMMQFSGAIANGIICVNRTSNTTFSSNGCGGGAGFTMTGLPGLIYIRIQNTGAVYRAFFSPDNVNWSQFGTDIAVNNFFTTAPDQVIVFTVASDTGFSSASLLSYYVH